MSLKNFVHFLDAGRTAPEVQVHGDQPDGPTKEAQESSSGHHKVLAADLILANRAYS